MKHAISQTKSWCFISIPGTCVSQGLWSYILIPTFPCWLHNRVGLFWEFILNFISEQQWEVSIQLSLKFLDLEPIHSTYMQSPYIIFILLACLLLFKVYYYKLIQFINWPYFLPMQKDNKVNPAKVSIDSQTEKNIE